MPDPRLSAVHLGIQDPQDRQLASLMARLAAVEGRVGVLERTPTIPAIAGTPTNVARDGTPAADTTASKFWLRLGGVWKSVTLT